MKNASVCSNKGFEYETEDSFSKNEKCPVRNGGFLSRHFQLNGIVIASEERTWQSVVGDCFTPFAMTFLVS